MGQYVDTQPVKLQEQRESYFVVLVANLHSEFQLEGAGCLC